VVSEPVVSELNSPFNSIEDEYMYKNLKGDFSFNVMSGWGVVDQELQSDNTLAQSTNIRLYPSINQEISYEEENKSLRDKSDMWIGMITITPSPQKLNQIDNNFEKLTAGSNEMDTTGLSTVIKKVKITELIPEEGDIYIGRNYHVLTSKRMYGVGYYIKSEEDRKATEENVMLILRTLAE
jgi:hypothetical protein